ncbi:MAG: hypothetical protein ACTSRZ_11055 [Promethearchaeota archaeon]
MQNKNNRELNDIREKVQNQEQEVAIPALNYFFINLIVFSVGLIPASILIWSLRYIFPLLKLNTFFGLTNSTIFNIENFWTYFWYPLFIILALYIGILGLGFISRLFVNYWNKKSPPQEGLYIRQFDGKDVTDPRIKYYHFRGFIIKFPLWFAIKSPFPWMGNWILRYVGHNKISKTAIVLDAFPSLEFAYYEDDMIQMLGSLSSTHVIDGLYSNLTLKRNIISKNAIICPHSALAPGSFMHENTTILPKSLAPKNWHTNENDKFYGGVPARLLDHKYSGIFSRLKPELEEKFQKQNFVLL